MITENEFKEVIIFSYKKTGLYNNINELVELAKEEGFITPDPTCDPVVCEVPCVSKEEHEDIVKRLKNPECRRFSMKPTLVKKAIGMEGY